MPIDSLVSTVRESPIPLDSDSAENAVISIRQRARVRFECVTALFHRPPRSNPFFSGARRINVDVIKNNCPVLIHDRARLPGCYFPDLVVWIGHHLAASSSAPPKLVMCPTNDGQPFESLVSGCMSGSTESRLPRLEAIADTMAHEMRFKKLWRAPHPLRIARPVPSRARSKPCGRARL